MNRLPARFASAACLILGAAWIVWGIGQFRLGLRREHLRRDSLADPAVLVQNRDALKMATAHLALADYYSTELIPADRAGAIEQARRAIAAEPFWARPWRVLARERLLAGDIDGARIALRHADALEPRHPRGRLESVRLWALLGDSTKSLDTALELAALGPGPRIDAAKELVLTGRPPAEVFTALGGSKLPPAETADLVEALATRNAASMTAILALVPDSTRRDPAARTRVANLALAPLQPSLLADLWRHSTPAPLDVSGFLLANADLREAPFSEDFPLGWRPPSSRTSARVFWIKPDSQSPDGRIGIELPQWSEPLFRHPLYTFVLMPGPERTLATRVRVKPIARYAVETYASVGEQTIARSRHDGFTEDWQLLPLVIPATDAPALVTIFIEARRLKDADANDLTIEVGPLGGAIPAELIPDISSVEKPQPSVSDPLPLTPHPSLLPSQSSSLVPRPSSLSFPPSPPLTPHPSPLSLSGVGS